MAHKQEPGTHGRQQAAQFMSAQGIDIPTLHVALGSPPLLSYLPPSRGALWRARHLSISASPWPPLVNPTYSELGNPCGQQLAARAPRLKPPGRTFATALPLLTSLTLSQIRPHCTQPRSYLGTFGGWWTPCPTKTPGKNAVIKRHLAGQKICLLQETHWAPDSVDKWSKLFPLCTVLVSPGRLLNRRRQGESPSFSPQRSLTSLTAHWSKAVASKPPSLPRQHMSNHMLVDLPSPRRPHLRA